MNATNAYQAAIQDYVDRVRVLLAPSGQPAGERGGRGPLSYDQLTEQAQALAPVSARVTAESATLLDGVLPGTRIELETALLAKTMTDLELCGYLLQAAEDQQAKVAWELPSGRGLERSAPSRGLAEPQLKLLLGEKTGAPGVVARSVRKPKTITEARVELTLRAADALAMISERALDGGQAALDGLVSIGLDEVGKAVGLIGLDLARALGKAEQVSRLYQLFHEFLERAYESLIALLGPKVAEFVGQKVKGWLEKIVGGELLSILLENLYQTERTSESLRPTIMHSDAELVRFQVAIEKVSALDDAYRQQTGLVGKIIPRLKYLTLIPAAKLPQAKVALALALVLLAGYVVFVGADYVDAPTLEKLDRIPGVRREVEFNLALPI